MGYDFSKNRFTDKKNTHKLLLVGQAFDQSVITLVGLHSLLHGINIRICEKNIFNNKHWHNEVVLPVILLFYYLFLYIL